MVLQTSIFILFVLIFVVLYINRYRIVTDCLFRNNMKPLFHVDAVITYVDSDDPLWLRDMKSQPKQINETVNSRAIWRWKNNGEAEYVIKSIRKFAPWIRKIFIVVSRESQIPDWLPDDVIVVLHSDLFLNKGHLPTFNSTSIEANLFRIKGLSEHWIYFNDDCFLGNNVTPDDFLEYDFSSKKYRLRIGLEDYDSPTGKTTSSEIGYYSAWKNCNRILDRFFEPKPRKLTKHIPLIQKTSLHVQLNKLLPGEFDRVSAEKFRTTNIFNTTGGLVEYFALNTGEGVVYNKPSYLQVFVTDSKNLDKIIKNKPKFFNLQGTSSTQQGLIKSFLTDYYD